MGKDLTVTQAEWPIMELLWQQPRTLMELVGLLGKQQGWSKSTVTTMIRRMCDKGLVAYDTQGRTKTFRPGVSREDVTLRETRSLLQRAYQGSLGLLVSAMVGCDQLTKADIDELYAILKEAEQR